MMKAFAGLFKEHLAKVLLVFVLGGTATVLGMLPGTDNVSNIIGAKISDIKASIGTTGTSPTVVQ